MRRRFTGMATILLVLLMMPLSRACGLAPQRTQAKQDCCPQRHVADTCCTGSSGLCHATQAPSDTTQLPGQDASALVPPPATLVAMHQYRLDSFKPRLMAPRLPRQYTPPGLLIAATTVFRT